MMTKTTQQHDAATQNGIPNPGNALETPISHTPSLHPATDSASDNDTSERPVREKLKKTSIASIPQTSTNHPRKDVAVDSESITVAQKPEVGPFRNQEVVKTDIESRGRPLRKRSFDDLEAEEDDAGDRPTVEQSGHSRKRSRDVRVGEDIKGDERLMGTGQVSVQEENENENEANMVDKDVNGSRDQNTVTTKDRSRSPHRDIADEEMRDPAFSPRKKRSRDQLDTETHREQKIPATEEAKAHRRSEENEREEMLQDGNITGPSAVQSVQDKQRKHVSEPLKERNVSVLISTLFSDVSAHIAKGIISDRC